MIEVANRVINAEPVAEVWEDLKEILLSTVRFNVSGRFFTKINGL